MVFLLFIGSLVTLELILHSSKTEERGRKAGSLQQHALHSLPVDQQSMLALMQAVHRPGAPLQNDAPALQSQAMAESEVGQHL